MKTRKFPSLLAALALAPAALAACGDDDNGSEEAEGASTPQEAIREIAAVRDGLDAALAAYRDGDADAAQSLAEDAYLEHFELVEPPLEEADAELNEELEEQIREELVGEIEAGAPQGEVEALVKEIGSGLDEAESALGEGGA